MRHSQEVLLESYPVSRAISDPEREGYTLLEPVNPDEADKTSTEAEYEDMDDGD
jgi:hypothetical protein